MYLVWFTVIAWMSVPVILSPHATGTRMKEELSSILSFVADATTQTIDHNSGNTGSARKFNREHSLFRMIVQVRRPFKLRGKGGGVWVNTREKEKGGVGFVLPMC